MAQSGKTKEAAQKARPSAAPAKKKPAVRKKAVRKATAKKSPVRKTAAGSARAKKAGSPAARGGGAAAKRVRKSTTSAAASKRSSTATASSIKKKAATKKKVSAKKVPAAKKRGGEVARNVLQGQELRHAIYVDVENTSSIDALLGALNGLDMDRGTQRVELVAVGNWRAVGQQVGRELATLGAKLIHSAPARGVRDWSDLWIAVAAGAWIGEARPGDVLEIVSNDRAFDAVGDAAAARGVMYRRVKHRSEARATAQASTASGRKRRSRGGRGRRRSTQRSSESTATAVASPAAPVAAAEPHGASSAQMAAVIERLVAGKASPWVNLDVLESALKSEGFSRPPNSPRLVTRLRQLKDFEVDSHGRVRLSATSGSRDASGAAEDQAS